MKFEIPSAKSDLLQRFSWFQDRKAHVMSKHFRSKSLRVLGRNPLRSFFANSTPLTFMYDIALVSHKYDHLTLMHKQLLPHSNTIRSVAESLYVEVSNGIFMRLTFSGVLVDVILVRDCFPI